MSPAAIVDINDRHNVVDSTLNFWLDPDQGGHSELYPNTVRHFRRQYNTQPVKITNFRDYEDQFELETHGFQFGHSKAFDINYSNAQEVKDNVYPETERLLKEVTGASRVKVFSHIYRNNSENRVQKKIASDPDLQDDQATITDVVPATFVHVDYSNAGAQHILSDNISPPELAEKLRKTRWALINVWRPIKPIYKDPLAMCDGRTINDDDLMPMPIVFPQKGKGLAYAAITTGARNEIFYMKHDPAQKWYYRSGMEPGECFLIKCWDTNSSTTKRAPHSAFHDPAQESDGPPRESIEVRCIVFYEDQPIDA